MDDEASYSKGTLIVDETIPLEMRLTVAANGRAYEVLAGKQVVIDELPSKYSKSFISHITAWRDPDMYREAQAAREAPGSTSGVHRLRLDGEPKVGRKTHSDSLTKRGNVSRA